MTLPPFLAAIPMPVLVGVPVLGLGVVLWYELIYKKTPAAGSLAVAPAGAPVGPPAGASPPMGATYAPPPAAPAPKPKVVLKPIVMPHLTPNQQLAMMVWGTLQTLPKTFPNDPSGTYRGLAVAALQTIQNDPTAATLMDQIAGLTGSTNPGIQALAAKLSAFPTAGLT